MVSRAHVLALGVLGSLVGCADDGEAMTTGPCSASVWWRLRGPTAPEVTGSWDDWAAPQTMRRFDNDWWVAELDLAPGAYGYQIVADGRGLVDPHNPLTSFRASDGLEVSWLKVEDCRAPRLSVVEVEPSRDLGLDDPGLHLRLNYHPGIGEQPLDITSLSFAGAQVTGVTWAESDGDSNAAAQEVIDVELTTAGVGRHALVVQARDATGVALPELPLTTWSGSSRRQRDDQLIYQVMIDRYRGDEGLALDPPSHPGGRAGGTLGGVQAELEAGTFDQLGVSMLWLSPVYTNPIPAHLGEDGTEYEGYHGYWPLDSRGVEPRIGGEAALRGLVDAAHARGIAVIADLVPNHYHLDNPRVAQRRAQGWFHEREPTCVCGTPDCPWSVFQQSCWFTSYLPDLRFETEGVLDSAVEDALWWQENFALDGFRIDAVPMMPRAVTRRIVAASRAAAGDPDAVFHIGEVFTGPGTGGTEVIRYYLGPDGLDSAFDFPLMWALRAVLARDTTGFEALEQILVRNEQVLRGSQSSLAHMIGNHDVSRFASEVRPASRMVDAQLLAQGLILTLPGVPVIYYGDEIALQGGGDPDNRRVLPDDEELAPSSLELRDVLGRLGRLRRCHRGLRAGDRQSLLVARDTFAFVRAVEGEAGVVVIAYKGDVAQVVQLPPGRPKVPMFDLVSGEEVDLSVSGEVVMEPWRLRVLVPLGHACL